MKKYYYYFAFIGLMSCNQPPVVYNQNQAQQIQVVDDDYKVVSNGQQQMVIFKDKSGLEQMLEYAMFMSLLGNNGDWNNVYDNHRYYQPRSNFNNYKVVNTYDRYGNLKGSTTYNTVRQNRPTNNNYSSGTNNSSNGFNNSGQKTTSGSNYNSGMQSRTKQITPVIQKPIPTNNVVTKQVVPTKPTSSGMQSRTATKPKK